jgi:hypothetical protein
MMTQCKGYFFSFIIHSLILVLLFLLKVHIENEPQQEFIEIIALESVVIPKQQPIKASVITSKKVNNQKSETTPQSAQVQQIEVPKTVIPDFEPVDISSLPKKDNRNIKSTLYKANIDDTLMQAKLNTQYDVIGNQVSDDLNQSNDSIVETDFSDIGLEGLTMEYIRNSTGDYSGYKLEGDVINRTIVKKVLPEFPENKSIDATVILQFKVSEAGKVENIIITKKADAEFEIVSKNALKQWIFNTSNQSHTGIITFHFRIN